MVENHNLSSQAFGEKNVGMYKTHAMTDIIVDVNGKAEVFNIDKKFNGKEFKGGILIIAVDSMKERKRIYTNLKKSKVQPKFIIDGRMGGPQLEVYSCIDLNDWKETFVSQASSDPCGARYICYISMVIGSFIANQVKRFLKEEKYKKSILFNIDSLQLI